MGKLIIFLINLNRSLLGSTWKDKNLRIIDVRAG